LGYSKISSIISEYLPKSQRAKDANTIKEKQYDLNKLKWLTQKKQLTVSLLSVLAIFLGLPRFLGRITESSSSESSIIYYDFL